jgi:AcrR family transcriptional regulator
MAKVTTPRTRWVDEAFRALAAGGPDAIRVEALAKKLAVSKGGFYWHFADRQALLDELLDTWERRGVDDVIAVVDADGGDARAKLRDLFGLALAGGELRHIDLAIRDWARRDRDVAARVRRVDNRRMDYMRALFREICEDEADVEARSFLAFSLYVASDFSAADHGNRRRADVLSLAARSLLGPVSAGHAVVPSPRPDQ